VTLVLQPARRHRLGRLTLGLATAANFAWSGSTPTTGAALSTASMRDALDTLIGTHGLSLELAGGWLRATWMPMGFFLFPGRFEPAKWRDVLTHMQTLARELEETERKRAGSSRAATSAPR
jgi:hypothetical protein